MSNTKRNVKDIRDKMPAGGASRSIAPNLIYTSCDGTILAGVFKYSDAINNPDGNLLLSQEITSEHKKKEFFSCFKKKTFYPPKPQKPPKPPPPQIPAVLYQRLKSGGGSPP